MNEEKLTFAEFQAGYGTGGNYQPVFVGVEPGTKVLAMDLICHYRLGDGKIRFVKVSYETQEELDYLRAWVAREMEQMFVSIRKSLDQHVPLAV